MRTHAELVAKRRRVYALLHKTQQKVANQEPISWTIYDDQAARLMRILFVVELMLLQSWELEPMRRKKAKQPKEKSEMKTIETVVYEFDELDESAKEKARDWWRRAVEGDTSAFDCTINESVEQGKLLGIQFKTRGVPLRNGSTRKEPCIYYSGFASQGDGACFEGTWRAADVKADKVACGWGESKATTEIKRIASELAAVAKELPDCYAVARHSGHYYHKHSINIAVECDTVEPSPEQRDAIADVLRDFCDWIYRQLESEYDYQNSNECIDENIRGNEYTFTKEGERFGN